MTLLTITVDHWFKWHSLSHFEEGDSHMPGASSHTDSQVVQQEGNGPIELRAIGQ